MEYMNKIEEIFDAIDSEDENQNYQDLRKAKEIIKEISNEVKETKLFKESTERYNEFIENFNSINCNDEERAFKSYVHFLIKSVEAPTATHRIGVVILCIPVMDYMIDIAEENNKWKRWIEWYF